MRVVCPSCESACVVCVCHMCVSCVCVSRVHLLWVTLIEASLLKASNGVCVQSVFQLKILEIQNLKWFLLRIFVCGTHCHSNPKLFRIEDWYSGSYREKLTLLQTLPYNLLYSRLVDSQQILTHAFCLLH